MSRSRIRVPARSRVLSILAAGALAAGCPADRDERPAEFPYIAEAILRPSCATATCHDAMTRRGGPLFDSVDFSTVESAAEVVRELVPSTGSPEPDRTPFVSMLITTGELRMPVDSPLPEKDIDLIRTWIIEGAVFP